MRIWAAHRKGNQAPCLAADHGQTRIHGTGSKAAFGSRGQGIGIRCRGRLASGFFGGGGRPAGAVVAPGLPRRNGLFSAQCGQATGPEEIGHRCQIRCVPAVQLPHRRATDGSGGAARGAICTRTRLPLRHQVEAQGIDEMGPAGVGRSWRPRVCGFRTCPRAGLGGQKRPWDGSAKTACC